MWSDTEADAPGVWRAVSSSEGTARAQGAAEDADVGRILSALPAMIARGEAAKACADFESMPPHVLAARPDALMAWAECSLSSGDPSTAERSAATACDLFSASGSRERHGALALRIEALCRIGRTSDAETLLAGLIATDVPVEARVRAQRAVALGLASEGFFEESLGACGAIRESLGACRRGETVPFESVMSAFLMGHSARIARMMPPVLDSIPKETFEGVRARTDLALTLVVCGRLERAEAILDALDSDAPRRLVPRVLAVRAMIALGRDRTDDALRLLANARTAAVDSGFEPHTAAVRTIESAALRLSGRFDEALSSAERAVAAFDVCDHFGMRAVAKLEAAQALLAAGEGVTARIHAERVLAGGVKMNLIHTLCANLVIAEVELRAKQPDAAVARIKPFADFIRTGSANFHLALVCRVFPGLFGVIAVASSVEGVPAHMMRLLVPYRTRCREASAGLLSERELDAIDARFDILSDTCGSVVVERPCAPVCEIRLFGGFEVHVDGRRITGADWRKQKTRRLFAMLVTRDGQEVSRDEILDHLWGDLSADSALKNFYVTWSGLRAALMGHSCRAEGCPFVECDAGRCRVVKRYLESDVDRFRERLRSARDAREYGDLESAASAYREALGLYRGDLLSGELYDDWFSALRDRLRFDLVDACLQLGEVQIERGDIASALSCARRAQEQDPLREDACMLALRCGIAGGRRAGAVDTFDRYRRRLDEELGLDPSAALMQLYQRILVMEDGSPPFLS